MIKRKAAHIIWIMLLLLLLMPMASGMGKLVVGDNSFPPLDFLNEQNQPDGYDIAVMRLIQQKTGMPITIRLGNWHDVKQAVLAGQADILIGVAKTPEREALYEFSEPYLESRIVIFVGKEHFNVKSVQDLQNRRVAVQEGSVDEEYLSANYPAIRLIKYGSQLDALLALQYDAVDAVVGNYYTGMYWINKYNVEDKIKVVGKPLLETPYCFVVKKGDIVTLDLLNRGISSIKQSGELKALQDQWFGEDYFYDGLFRRSTIMKILGYILAAGTVVLVLGMAHVYSLRKKVASATAQLRQANGQITAAYEVTIKAFFTALEHRESRTARHSLEVNKIAMKIGGALELSQEDLFQLNWGTLLHDIGKLVVNDAILLKPSALTEEEYGIIKKHPRTGFAILEDADYLREAAKIALHHHERFDGQGYPCGLAGEEIPLLARICSVADAFEAMVANRPYRAGRPVNEAVAELVGCSGRQFDPQVVEAFLGLDLDEFIYNNN